MTLGEYSDGQMVVYSFLRSLKKFVLFEMEISGGASCERLFRLLPAHSIFATLMPRAEYAIEALQILNVSFWFKKN